MVAEIGYNGVMGARLQSQLLQYNQVNPAYLTAFGSIAQSTAVLNSRLGSTLANAAGIQEPYPGFTTFWNAHGGATVRQALRPYPQYAGIDTYSGGGDHSGHSTYHAAILRFEKRLSGGLTFQTSYVFSKLLTDSDSYWGIGYSAADQYNRGLEKSIGQFDVTHNFKFAAVYDLPFGHGKPYLNHGPGAWALGDWRITSVNLYLAARRSASRARIRCLWATAAPRRTQPVTTDGPGRRRAAVSILTRRRRTVATDFSRRMDRARSQRKT